MLHRGRRSPGPSRPVGDRVGTGSASPGGRPPRRGWPRTAGAGHRPGRGRGSAVTAGMKPRSAMWSASSSTTTSTRVRSAAPWSIRSISRPGVATRMSTPRSKRVELRPYGMPPATSVRLSPWMRASGASTSATCRASSRVGHQDQARGAACGWRAAGQRGDHRQTEAERLARAGLAAAEHVPAGERVGDGGGLDRERLGDAAGVQRRDQRLGHTELGEATGGRQRRGRRSVDTSCDGASSSSDPTRAPRTRCDPDRSDRSGRSGDDRRNAGPAGAGPVVGRRSAADPVIGRTIRPGAVVGRTVVATRAIGG